MNLGEMGKKGEDMVSAFLKAKGYAIIKRNYYCRFGEIDIIAQIGDIIAFVEVKTRKKNSLVSPIEAVDFRKTEKMRLTAEDYLSKTEVLFQPRFDVAQITVDSKGGFHLNYLKNAF